MRAFIQMVFIALVLVVWGCAKKDNIDPALKQSYPAGLNVPVMNTESFARDAVVEIPAEVITGKAATFNPAAFVILSDGNELPSQAVDVDSDGAFDALLVGTNFQPNEKKELTILFAETGENQRQYPKLTQAELSQKFGGKWENRKYVGGGFRNVEYASVPPEHTDHSFFYRYEGPGWESDKVGYRFYLDWRNATDIFGKKTPAMILQNVGLDGFDSYHEMSDWGLDILKVGASLGIGSLGMLGENGKVNRVEVTDSITCQIAENGAIYSQIRTKYFGWKVEDNKYDVVSDLSIVAGSRMTKHEVEVTGSPSNLCTGIVKLPETSVLEGNFGNNGWSYLATWGKQSLAEDSLGMAVLYKSTDLFEVTEDAESHVIVLKPENGKLIYYFLAAWEKEPNGIQTEAAFKAYLDLTVEQINNPVVMTTEQ